MSANGTGDGASAALQLPAARRKFGAVTYSRDGGMR
jgi:hypothetical protein